MLKQENEKLITAFSKSK